MTRSLALFACISIMPLFGQGLLRTAFASQQVWDGNQLVTSEGSEITLEQRGIKPIRHVLPSGHVFCTYQAGTAFTVKISKQRKVVELFSSKDFRTWTRVGLISRDLTPFGFKAIPLENGKFFLMAHLEPFAKGEKASIFAIATVDDKENLALDELLEPGLSKSVCVKEPAQPGLLTPGFMVRNEYQALIQATLDPCNPICYRGGFAVVSRETGHMFCFSGKTGRLRRIIQIHSSLDENAFARPTLDLDQAILGLQPRPDGRIFLASRTEEALTEAWKLFKSTSVETVQMTNPQWSEHTQQVFKNNVQTKTQQLLAHPEVLYFQADPETGDVFLDDTPPGLPSRLWDLATFRQFRFRMTQSGHPAPDSRMLPPMEQGENLVEKSPTRVKKNKENGQPEKLGK